MMRDKLQQKLHRVTSAYSVQSWKAQRSCEISCKESMLHAAINRKNCFVWHKFKSQFLCRFWATWYYYTVFKWPLAVRSPSKYFRLFSLNVIQRNVTVVWETTSLPRLTKRIFLSLRALISSSFEVRLSSKLETCSKIPYQRKNDLFQLKILFDSQKSKRILDFFCGKADWYRNSPGATCVFEDLLHPLVRKLYLHLKEAILHMQWENQWWTCQFLIASEI